MLPPDTLVNKYQMWGELRKKVYDERFVSQIGEFPVAVHIYYIKQSPYRPTLKTQAW